MKTMMFLLTGLILGVFLSAGSLMAALMSGHVGIVVHGKNYTDAAALIPLPPYNAEMEPQVPADLSIRVNARSNGRHADLHTEMGFVAAVEPVSFDIPLDLPSLHEDAPAYEVADVMKADFVSSPLDDVSAGQLERSHNAMARPLPPLAWGAAYPVIYDGPRRDVRDITIYDERALPPDSKRQHIELSVQD